VSESMLGITRYVGLGRNNRCFAVRCNAARGSQRSHAHALCVHSTRFKGYNCSSGVRDIVKTSLQHSGATSYSTSNTIALKHRLLALLPPTDAIIDSHSLCFQARCSVAYLYIPRWTCPSCVVSALLDRGDSCNWHIKIVNCKPHLHCDSGILSHGAPWRLAAAQPPHHLLKPISGNGY
jgi:hypothetical protein